MRTDALRSLAPELNLATHGPASLRAGAGRSGFEGALTHALSRGGGGTERSPREAAQEFVAVALVQPILAQAREANDAAPPFAPGDAERRFGPLLDAEIAHRIVKKSRFPLVDRVEAELTRGRNGAAGVTHG